VIHLFLQKFCASDSLQYSHILARVLQFSVITTVHMYTAQMQYMDASTKQEWECMHKHKYVFIEAVKEVVQSH